MRFVLLWLCILLFAGPQAQAQDFSKLSEKQKLDLIKSYVQFVLDSEKIIPPQYSKINFNFFLEEAFAISIDNCLFAGWESKVGTDASGRTTCLKPSVPKTLGTCTTSEVRCNPALFGAKAGCVSIRGNPGPSARCAATPRSLENAVQYLRENPRAFAETRAFVNSLCADYKNNPTLPLARDQVSTCNALQSQTQLLDQNSSRLQGVPVPAIIPPPPPTPIPAATPLPTPKPRNWVEAENRKLVNFCFQNPCETCRNWPQTIVLGCMKTISICRRESAGPPPVEPLQHCTLDGNYELKHSKDGISLGVKYQFKSAKDPKKALEQMQKCIPMVKEVWERYGIKVDIAMGINDYQDPTAKGIAARPIPVTLHDKFGRSDSSNFFLGSQSEDSLCKLFLHEMGHSLGFPDEYPDKDCPDRLTVNTEPKKPMTIMNDQNRELEDLDYFPRHIRRLLNPLCPRIMGQPAPNFEPRAINQGPSNSSGTSRGTDGRK